MYWYKSTKYFAAVTCALMGAALLTACQPEVKETGAPVYFDVKGYFKSEAARLSKQNKPVLKTVTHNGATESKTVNIKNWDNELSMFAAADINKPAFKDSYIVNQTASTIVYKAKDEALETRDIIISKKPDGTVKWMLIFTHTPKNLLYETKSKLSWFPDSLYQIQKTQTVRLLGKNSYDISGKLNQ